MHRAFYRQATCRICGWGDGEILWDRYGVPQYVICYCCGNESGLGDDHLSKVREIRGYWVVRGAPWDVPSRRPENWDLLAQLAHIPPEWR